MADSAQSSAGSTVDPAEIERFSRIAEEWWDPAGKFAPLHQLNPVRIGYHPRPRRRPLAARRPVRRPSAGPRPARHRLRRRAALRADGAAGRPGHRHRCRRAQHRHRHACMPRARAWRSTIARPRPRRWPGRASSSTSCWRSRSSSTWPTSSLFLRSCGRLVKPGGLLFLSTLNRTAKAWALAIAGAEYVLRWLPRGTHDWKKFLKPSEVVRGLRGGGDRGAGDRRRGL